jgi:hypothetical protein
MRGSSAPIPASMSYAAGRTRRQSDLTKTQKILDEFRAQCRISMARFRDPQTDAIECGYNASALHFDTLAEAFCEIVENLETAFKAVVKVE